MESMHDMPMNESYDRVAVSWNSLTDELERYLTLPTDPQAIGQSVGEHSVALGNFINVYFEIEEPSQENIASLGTALITLHGDTLTSVIKKHGLEHVYNSPIFHLLDADDVHDYTDQLLSDPEGDIDIENSLHATISSYLTGNLTVMLNYCQMIQPEKHDKINTLKDQAVGVGRTALGVFLGLSVFAFTQKFGKRS